MIKIDVLTYHKHRVGALRFKPEAAKMVSSAIEKREINDLIINLGLFVTGVLCPYVINYIFLGKLAFTQIFINLLIYGS